MEEKTNENISRWNQFNLIIDDENLNNKEKCLLLIIFRYVNYKTGYANPSRELIKNLYGTKKNDVLDKVLNSLIEKGYIVRETGKGIRSKYFIKVGAQIEPSTKIECGTQIESIVGTQIEPIVGTQIEPQKEKERKEKKIIYKDLKFIDDVIDEVKITEEQYQKLIDKYSSTLVNSQIENLDNYIANGKGSKYKDHYKVLNTWCKKERERKIRSLDVSKINQDDFIIG